MPPTPIPPRHRFLWLLLASMAGLPLLVAALFLGAAFLGVRFEAGDWSVGAEKNPEAFTFPQGFYHSRTVHGPPDAPSLDTETWSFQVSDLFWYVNRAELGGGDDNTP